MDNETKSFKATAASVRQHLDTTHARRKEFIFTCRDQDKPDRNSALNEYYDGLLDRAVSNRRRLLKKIDRLTEEEQRSR